MPGEPWRVQSVFRFRGQTLFDPGRFHEGSRQGQNGRELTPLRVMDQLPEPTALTSEPRTPVAVSRPIKMGPRDPTAKGASALCRLGSSIFFLQN
ncbi:hypothetical protein GGTG_07787 [Gaeumannomyces tritici R3-111a-1]|uniref:Uncharacterized protein n=1 Tax=Gaeumannomyces tritici (strain R3-111a-1) TaxID=644352 RepID=J3P2P1_GAET3|nr:hypothetical protein GGTG_07787 [Gaeumannomyces tritici R3-111a-1]EJT73933.1 hypothetical protein GGTG_07787 [Gaeumannomyces tritici R3-111a-1]